MDDLLRRKVLELARGLANEEHERLEEAGTFVDLETLTAQIGDELGRQLANIELTRRADATAAQEAEACPECGQECRFEPEREPLILQGMRGDIEYSEPRCHCTRCRRDFFPSGGPHRTRGAGDGDAVGAGEDGVGRRQPGKP